MIYKPKTIEEHILFVLVKGPASPIVILKKIQEKRPKTTKQALYQILTKLKNEEMVIGRSKLVSLSHIWINKMNEYFATAKRSYRTTDTPNEDFLQLEDGDKISYTFKSPEHTDMFWGHAFSILTEVTPLNTPVYIYNPHEWFMLARYETERTLFDDIRTNGKKLFVLAGHKDKLDIEIAKEFNNDMSQYHPLEEKLFEKENYYFNVFDDFIIEAWLDPEICVQIDSFYKQTKIMNKDAIEKLKYIVSKKGRNKLTISRNRRKAEKFKKQFTKYFFIK